MPSEFGNLNRRIADYPPTDLGWVESRLIGNYAPRGLLQVDD